MADYTLNLLGSDINPYVPPAGLQYTTGSVDGRIFGGYYRSTGATTAAIIYTASPSGNTIRGSVVLASIGSDTTGVCICGANGNGYFGLIRVGDYRLFRATASNTGLTQIGATYTGTFSVNDVIELQRDLDTGVMRLYQNGILRSTITDNTHAAEALRVGFFSRGGGLSSFTVYNISLPPTITSINSGNPIRVGAPSVVAAHTDFTGAITSITTNRDGLTATVISGDANSTTFSLSDWIDGQQYPELDSNVTFTFSRSGESAAADQTVTYPVNWEKVTFNAPINDDERMFGKIFTDAGFTTLNAVCYYDTSTIPGLVIKSDTSGDPLDDGGTFGAWLRTVSGTGAGEMYYFELTIAEDGAAAGGGRGLTSVGLTSSGLTMRGLTAVGL